MRAFDFIIIMYAADYLTTIKTIGIWKTLK